MDRRSFLAWATASGLSLGMSARAQDGQPARGADHTLTAEDDALLEELERRAFRYFWEHGDERTGHVPDRTRADGSRHPQSEIASIAATGYGLTALAIAADRGWERRSAIAARVRSSLRFLARDMPHEHGWFYHFVDRSSGAREWACELSSIDTALLLAGVLTARQAFGSDAQVVEDATAIYNRVDFPWMLNRHPTLLSMGWKPESGFLDARWEHYCELMILYLLAIGSPARALPAASWQAWRRPTLTWGRFSYIGAGDPLFVHQYSHAWVDFRGRAERKTGIDWFANSVTATRAHKAFCLSLAGEFPGYRDDVWGITASDSAKGYVAWGGPPRHPAIDGSVVPCAAGGSLMFAPDLCVPVMRALRDRFGSRVWGRYGFVDAFNPASAWTDADVLGIDLGITLLSAENLRSGSVWRWFMRNPEIGRAMMKVGLEQAAAGGLPPRELRR
jgi:hypothetical protein